jgi:hypothetical protein
MSAIHVKQPMSALLGREAAYVIFVFHTCCTLAREAAYVIFVFHTCLHFGTWISLCDICLPYLSTLLAPNQPMWYLSSIPVCTLVREAAYVIFVFDTCLHCWHEKQPMWYLSAIPVCTLAREAAYGLCLPYLFALLAQEADYVKSICHTCQHCW